MLNERWHRFQVLVIVLAVLLSAIRPVLVGATADYYADTGHYLYGQFRDYWNGNGGLGRFGFPITKVFDQKSTTGTTYTTQYLQRAVFEYHPENRGTPFDVLGRRLAALQTVERAKSDPNFRQVANPSDGRLWFADTGHTIGGDSASSAIRTYWEAAGSGNMQRSILVFGYPISEPFDEQNAPPPAGDGRMHRVQYFERFRLEYHPENPDPNKVLLGLLGVSQADTDNLDPTLRAPEAANQPQPDCIGQDCTASPITTMMPNQSTSPLSQLPFPDASNELSCRVAGRASFPCCLYPSRGEQCARRWGADAVHREVACSGERA